VLLVELLVLAFLVQIVRCPTAWRAGRVMVYPLRGADNRRRCRGRNTERRQGGDQLATRHLASAGLFDDLVEWLLGWRLAMLKTSHLVLLSSLDSDGTAARG
jgi:hypothetical protein